MEEILKVYFKGVESVRECTIQTYAYEVHVKEFNEMTPEESEKAWNELSYEYSNVIHQLCMLADMVNTYKTFK